MEQDQISILVQSRQLHWVTKRKSKQVAPAEGAEIHIQDKRAEKAKITANLQALNLENAQMLSHEDTPRPMTDLKKKKQLIKRRFTISESE